MEWGAVLKPRVADELEDARLKGVLAELRLSEAPGCHQAVYSIPQEENGCIQRIQKEFETNRGLTPALKGDGRVSASHVFLCLSLTQRRRNMRRVKSSKGFRRSCGGEPGRGKLNVVKTPAGE
jgi:hypothetical protein